MQHQLKIIKANCVGGAKSQWYDWKSEWVDRLLESAEETFGGLESDAKFLEQVIGETQGMLPSLRAEYAQVMDELEKEEAAVAELEMSDKEYLNELKVSIAEQELVIYHYNSEAVSDVSAALRFSPSRRMSQRPRASFKGCKKSLTKSKPRSRRSMRLLRRPSAPFTDRRRAQALKSSG